MKGASLPSGSRLGPRVAADTLHARERGLSVGTEATAVTTRLRGHYPRVSGTVTGKSAGALSLPWTPCLPSEHSRIFGKP